MRREDEREDETRGGRRRREESDRSREKRKKSPEPNLHRSPVNIRHRRERALYAFGVIAVLAFFLSGSNDSTPPSTPSCHSSSAKLSVYRYD